MEAESMRMDGQAIALGGDLSLPWNLQEWSTSGVLRGWVEAEIGTLAWDSPELAQFLRQRPRYEPRKLLCLLTYAYASAVFESEEIQQRCLTDPDCRVMAGPGWQPDAGEITRFRRENRGLLKWALLQVFKRALRAHLGDFMLPAGLKGRLVAAAAVRLDFARQMDREHQGS